LKQYDEYKNINELIVYQFQHVCYNIYGGTGGVSFANKNVSGLQKYLRFQNEYNKVEIELRVVQFDNAIRQRDSTTRRKFSVFKNK
jgi:hypothetical protein